MAFTHRATNLDPPTASPGLLGPFIQIVRDFRAIYLVELPARKSIHYPRPESSLERAETVVLRGRAACAVARDLGQRREAVSGARIAPQATCGGQGRPK
jgi:hypothetical protein